MLTSVPRAVLLVVLEADWPEGEKTYAFSPEVQGHKGPKLQRAAHSAHKNCIQSTLLLFLLPAYISCEMRGMDMIY